MLKNNGRLIQVYLFSLIKQWRLWSDLSEASRFEFDWPAWLRIPLLNSRKSALYASVGFLQFMNSFIQNFSAPFFRQLGLLLHRPIFASVHNHIRIVRFFKNWQTLIRLRCYRDLSESSFGPNIHKHTHLMIILWQPTLLRAARSPNISTYRFSRP